MKGNDSYFFHKLEGLWRNNLLRNRLMINERSDVVKPQQKIAATPKTTLDAEQVNKRSHPSVITETIIYGTMKANAETIVIGNITVRIYVRMDSPSMFLQNNSRVALPIIINTSDTTSGVTIG